MAKPANTRPPGIASANYLLDNYRRSANARGLSFELTLVEFIAICSEVCHYCMGANFEYNDEVFPVPQG